MSSARWQSCSFILTACNPISLRDLATTNWAISHSTETKKMKQVASSGLDLALCAKKVAFCCCGCCSRPLDIFTCRVFSGCGLTGRPDSEAFADVLHGVFLSVVGISVSSVICGSRVLGGAGVADFSKQC